MFCKCADEAFKMHQIIQQSKWLCWQTSGWNELMKQHKKKKKRGNHSHLSNNISNREYLKCRKSLNLIQPLPRMILPLAMLFLPMLLLSCFLTHLVPNSQAPSTGVSCQLIIEHPKNRNTIRQPIWPMFSSARSDSLPDNGSDYSGIRQSDISRLELDIFNAASVSNYSMLPTSKEERDEFVRKLSSTTLLQTLLKRPLPINKLPLPALPLSILTDRTQAELTQPKNSALPNKNRYAADVTSGQAVSATALDVSTTNLTAVTGVTPFLFTNDDTLDHLHVRNLTKPESFRAGPLNFLVERLLKGEHFRQEDKLKRKRPDLRQKLPSNASLNIHNLSHPLPPNPMTLDMLIKDEYDSRVEPMLKSLLIQQQLSAQKSAKNHESQSQSKTSRPNNHKVDDTSINNFTVRSLTGGDVSENSTSSNYNGITTPVSSSSENVVSLSPEQNNLVSFEDAEDIEDEEEPEEEGEEVPGSLLLQGITGATHSSTNLSNESSTRKPLSNVPPYQYSHNLGSIMNRSTFARPKEVQVTTGSSSDLVTSNFEYDKRGDHISDRSTDATTKGSLVFSDGGYEGESGNRKKETNVKVNSVKPEASKKRKEALHTVGPARILPNGKAGDGSLLQQLFSTINPIADFEHRFKENSRDLDFKSPDPLIYKGYVGKDDYLLSSTARDWSRPLNNRSNSAADMFKYSYNGLTTTTQSPLTESSAVTYNPFTSQPVTNGQAVPTMVIPTSDPSEFPTTLPPLPYDQTRRRFIVQRSQIVPSQLHSIPVSKPLLNRSPTPYQTGNRTNSSERKYSYQFPNRYNETQNQVQHNHSHVNLNNTKFSNELEGDFGKAASSSKYPVSEELDNSWSPTKVISGETLQSNQRRRSQVRHGDTNNLMYSRGALNSSSPVLVPITKYSPTLSVTNRTAGSSFATDQGDDTVPSFMTTTATPPVASSGVVGRKESAENGFATVRKDTSRADPDKRSNIQRDKSKVPSPSLSTQESPASGANELSMGDSDTDQELRNAEENSESGSGGRRIKRPSGDRRERPEKVESDVADDYLTEIERDSEDNTATYRQKQNNKRQFKDRRNNPTLLDKTDANEENNRKPNQVVRGSIKHDVAESEISVTGIDKNLQLAGGRPHNKTTVRNPSSKAPGRMNGTNLMSNDGSLPAPTTVESSPPTSSDSAIIPNSNFVIEASSETPTLESSLMNLNNNVLDGKSTPIQVSDDQRRINAILNIQSSTPGTSSSVNIPTSVKIPSTSATTPQTTAKQDETSVGSNNHENTKPSAKSSNDRLAFILIGGSCALSVVCLVLAAMSMRCQDMCDDYRSLRNAERAALKLQKHRLKYTKNHQINSFNPNRTSFDAAHTFVDNISGPSNAASNSNGVTDINQSSNNKCLNNRFIQFTDQQGKNNITEQNNMWTAPICQLPASAMLNKELHSCRCSNCVHQRGWFHSDDVMASNKHLSWLHPYYYMQQHARLRPLFGAGSSVGTFFPRRLDDQNFADGGRGGSTDAQILIDSQPPHKCTTTESRGVVRSKSILHKSKRHPKLANGLSMSRDLHNSNCNNPDHNHSRHVCHNHRYNIETTTSEESELTLDDSILCDSAKCSANHQNLAHLTRHKLAQLKPNVHSHHQSVWKQASARKAGLSRNHTHQHHHHHHQQVSSSDGGSLAPCTCARDNQPLLSSSHRHNPHRTSHKHLSKQELRASLQAQARRDKLIWSTNRDRLI